MNSTRRKSIQKLIDNLEEIKFEIETIQEEEQQYIDNIPENFQGSERAELAEEASSNIEFSVDSLQETIDYLQTAIL